MRRALVLFVVCAFLSMPISAFERPAGAAACSWSLESPASPRRDAALNSIDGAGEDLWTVGVYSPRTGADRTLTEHLTADGWQVVPSPNRGDRENELTAVEYVDANDVWAVGTAAVTRRRSRNIAVHWTGTAWGRSVIPSPRRFTNSLSSIDAVATSMLPLDQVSTYELWAVGETEGRDFANPRGQIVRYAEGEWVVQTLPRFNRGYVLGGVDAVAHDDVWAAGTIAPNGESKPLVLHYNGTEWTRAAIPSLPGAIGTTVFASAPDDVWVGGMDESGRSLILHYDGSGWTRSDTPAADPDVVKIVSSVTQESDGDVWAVGLSLGRTEFEFSALILRWDGATWTQQQSPSSDPVQALLDVAAIPEGARWAVGFRAGDSRSRPLILRCG